MQSGEYRGLVDLSELSFDDSFVRHLPADPEQNNRPRQVANACYSLVSPTPLPDPELYAWSESIGDQLGIKRPAGDHSLAVEALAGNRVLAGMRPYAACYGGHQFGHWAGQLGDGRAITLAEMINRSGQRLEIQLKGAGQTPYSRHADGRAVLRSSIREFLCSEAMHHLGIPTTRALSLIKTKGQVVRDMFYDGHAELETCAVVTRVAPTFVRFGSFEILNDRRETNLLRRLADYVISHHYPELDLASPTVYSSWFFEICKRTAVMIAHWLRVGFVHGVMNTDNMSILGLTIDYGPYGWLDGFDPHWTPNTTDAGQRRYRYANQASIGLWNLERLGESMGFLLASPEDLDAGLAIYHSSFTQAHQQMMAQKLGLKKLDGPADQELLANLYQALQVTETDMTIFFRQLTQIDCSQNDSEKNDRKLIEPLNPAFYSEELTQAQIQSIATWLRQFKTRSRQETIEPVARIEMMNAANPKYILRNYLAQEAIDAAEQGDKTKIEELLKVMSRPYDEQVESLEYAKKRPEWARLKPGCSALSCSS